MKLKSQSPQHSKGYSRTKKTNNENQVQGSILRVDSAEYNKIKLKITTWAVTEFTLIFSELKIQIHSPVGSSKFLVQNSMQIAKCQNPIIILHHKIVR